MTIPSDHRDIEELLGAYAVHALTEDERVEVECHLETCVTCRQEVDAYFEIAAALAAAQAGHPLPTGLWDRIAGELPSKSTRSDGEGPTPHAPLRRRARVRRSAVVGAAAAAVAVISLLAVSLQSTSRQLAQARDALSGSAAEFRHALTVSGHRTATLRTSSGSVIAEVVVDPGGRGYLLSSGMPNLARGRTFQLWAMVNGKPISIGLFGNRPKTIAFELGSAAVTGIAVTIEPAGGTRAPTAPILAAGTV